MSEQTMIVGDSREVLRKIDTEFNLVLTDPPYNIGVEYPGGYDDRKSTGQFLEFIGEVMTLCYQRLRDDGSLFFYMGSNYQAHCLVLLQKIGFLHRRTIILHNTFGQAQQKNFTPSWTAIHYMTKSDLFTFNDGEIRVPSQRQLRYNDQRANPRGKLPDDVWVLMPDIQAPEAFAESGDLWMNSRVCGTFKERSTGPTQLAIPALERIIKVSTNPGDYILDPFSGTGTIPVVARQLDRDCLGIEISEEQVQAARTRLGI